jgi:hypothetical protein
MRRTRTLDYAVILPGEIDMLLDESKVHPKAGDAVIQQAIKPGSIEARCPARSHSS